MKRKIFSSVVYLALSGFMITACDKNLPTGLDSNPESINESAIDKLSGSFETDSSDLTNNQDSTSVLSQVNAAEKSGFQVDDQPPAGAFPQTALITVQSHSDDDDDDDDDRNLKGTIQDAWWTYQVDNDKDGYYSSARLNWNPNVVGGNYSLKVYEIVWWKRKAETTWRQYKRLPDHYIFGTRFDIKYVDVSGFNYDQYDWAVCIYRSGKSSWDYCRYSGNDYHLNDYKLERNDQDLKEDCIYFDYRYAQVKYINRSWKIVVGNIWLLDFGYKYNEAVKALKIIKYYRMNSQCFVGRPNPSMEYYLVNGYAPVGPYPGEDAIYFNPYTIQVKRINNRWKIVDGNHYILDFGYNYNEASQAFKIIKKHGFRYICFVGRPNASMTYFRK